MAIIKSKIQQIKQEYKENPTVKKNFKYLFICILTICVYSIFAKLDLGIVGLIIRVSCFFILLYILFKITKK